MFAKIGTTQIYMIRIARKYAYTNLTNSSLEHLLQACNMHRSVLILSHAYAGVEPNRANGGHVNSD